MMYACDECINFSEHDGKIFCCVSEKEIELPQKVQSDDCPCQNAASYWKKRALRAESRLSDCMDLLEVKR